jgi:hypothetical protein
MGEGGFMTEENISCVQPVSEEAKPATPTEGSELLERRVTMDVARVGKKAPEFTGQAYIDGAFKQVKLSDYAGKWVMICFYPGDFTFV